MAMVQEDETTTTRVQGIDAKSMGPKVTNLEGSYRIPCQAAAECGYWLFSVRVLIAKSFLIASEVQSMVTKGLN